MTFALAKTIRAIQLFLLFAATGALLVLLTGCGSAISAFIGSQPQAQVIPQVPSRWGDGGITISSGRSFSSSSEMSADYALNPRHRTLTSTAVSADVSMNQSRGKLQQ